MDCNINQTPEAGSRVVEFSGKRVLLVEDEYFIADDLRHLLRKAGAEVVGPCATLEKATAAVDEGAFDCAIVDLNLKGKSALPLAQRLQAEGWSFAFATGYGCNAIPDELKHVPRIEKPFDPAALLNLIGQLSCAKTS